MNIKCMRESIFTCYGMSKGLEIMNIFASQI